MIQTLKNLQDDSFKIARIPYLKPKAKIGKILLDLQHITPQELTHALAIQNREQAKLGEILCACGFTNNIKLIKALEKQYNLVFRNIKQLPVDMNLATYFNPQICLKLKFCLIGKIDKYITIAVANPNLINKIEQLTKKLNFKATYFLSNKADIYRQIAHLNKCHLRHQAQSICPKMFSCRTIFRRSHRLILILSALLCIFILIYFHFFWHAIYTIIGIALIGNFTLKLSCLLQHFINKYYHPKISLPNSSNESNKNKHPLPKVGILIPLLYEEKILSKLIQRLSRLDYPKELLEIILIIEENDTEMKISIDNRNLPSWISVIEVPHGEPQTKPRALNYAFNFCHCEIIGIYDAEDAPEPQQIHKVVQHLYNSDEKLACVQAILDFYNPRTNWMSRCFTIEYAILFRIILKSLSSLRLPMPLGGTSVFFKRAILEKIGCWDAHNVTEDAELGMRLYRMGYYCQHINSVTYEEANCRLWPWIKQRSRWQKGFLMTWICYIRHPIYLLKQLNIKGFCVFNVVFLGTFVSYFTIPFALQLWLLSFGVDLPISGIITPILLQALIINFICTEILLFILAITAVSTPSLRYLRWTALTLMLYWPIGCLASYKALYEIIVKPLYWDKTIHGIN